MDKFVQRQLYGESLNMGEMSNFNGFNLLKEMDLVEFDEEEHT